MGKFLLLLLAAILLVPRLLRLLVPSRSASRRQRSDTEAQPPEQETLRDLTQQDISDADFEDIPPEE